MVSFSAYSCKKVLDSFLHALTIILKPILRLNAQLRRFSSEFCWYSFCRFNCPHLCSGLIAVSRIHDWVLSRLDLQPSRSLQSSGLVLHPVYQTASRCFGSEFEQSFSVPSIAGPGRSPPNHSRRHFCCSTLDPPHKSLVRINRKRRSTL